MVTIALYSIYLLLGLFLSQWLPHAAPTLLELIQEPLTLFSMICLSYIMILVGAEFKIDKENPRKYIMDYIVAATAAAFPWLFVAVYYIAYFYDGAYNDLIAWRDTLLIARFAAPTSAGILFSMLTAAGLAQTWVFRKARILAIFDDLDTILLMIPLKVLFVGLKWQLLLILVVMVALLYLAWVYQDTWRTDCTPAKIFGYAVAVTALSEILYLIGYWIDPEVPFHIEVLLPAFVLGVILDLPHARIETPQMKSFGHMISSVFMVLVGLSMPYMADIMDGSVSYQTLFYHVMNVTILANIGKCFVIFCYRQQATLKERLAVAVGLFPRGEVGAGIIIVTLSYGMGGIAVSIALLSLCLNLIMTGLFISIVKYLCNWQEEEDAKRETPRIQEG